MFIVVELIGYQYLENISKIVIDDSFSDTGRVQNTEFFENPLEVVKYSLDALTQKDLDKFIRGCAVQEQAYGMEYRKILEQQMELSYRYSPSGNWLYYFPLMHAILTQEACEMYYDLSEVFKNARIMNIDYADLEYQLSDEYVQDMYKKCEMWRASGLCEITVLYENSAKEHRQKSLFVINYNGQWKLKVDEQSVKSEPSKINIEENRDESIESSFAIQYEDKYQISKMQDVPVNALLPCNYSCYKERGEKSPEKLIEEFIYTLRKGDFEEAFTYFYNEDEGLGKYIEYRGENAQHITDLIYKLLEIKPSETAAIQDTLNQMNPENIIYLRSTIVESEVIDPNSVKVEVELQINRKQQHIELNLGRTEWGWMILSLKPDYFG